MTIRVDLFLCLSVKSEDIERRVRDSIKVIEQVDIREVDDFMKAITPADCITGILGFNEACENPDDFKNLMLELASKLKSEGTLLMALVANSSGYEIGGKIIPAACVSVLSTFECLHCAGFNDIRYQWFQARTPSPFEEIRYNLFVSAKLSV